MLRCLWAPGAGIFLQAWLFPCPKQPLCPRCAVRRAVESPHVHTIIVWELSGSIIMPNNLCFKFPGIAFRKLFFSRGTIWRGCGNLTKSTSASSSPGFIRSISPMVCFPRNKPEILNPHRRWLLEQTNFVLEIRLQIFPLCAVSQKL